MATPEDLLFQGPNQGGGLLAQVGPPAPSQQVGPPAPAQPGAPVPAAAPQAPTVSGIDQIANRISKASISFLTGTPQIELDRLEAENRLIDEQAKAAKQQGEAIAAERIQREQLTNLFGIVSSPNTSPADKKTAATAAMISDPELATEIFAGLGVVEQTEKNRLADRAFRVEQMPSRQAKNQEIMRQIVAGEAEGRDMSESKALLSLPDAELDANLAMLQAAALTPEQRLERVDAVRRGVDVTAETLTAAARAEVGGFTEEEIRGQALVEAGLQARAGTSARERIATDEELGAQVIDFEARLKERGKFSELTGASRAKAIDEGFKTIRTIDANILNLDRAVAALDAGAETGSLIARFTPTIREQSVVLQQIQASLGLDVVQSVSFGALSEGELSLALATALPINLDEPALRQWILDRQGAQRKLRGYLEEQIDFLDEGGTLAGFLRKQRRDDRGTGSGDTVSFDAEGRRIP